MSPSKIKRLYLIPILSKALDVIELLEKTTGSVTLEHVYQETNISKTSVYRILKTLVHRGYVAQSASGDYRLVSRPRRLRFGFAAQSSDLPFSLAVQRSIEGAAAAAGVELVLLDNRSDPQEALRNAEEFVRRQVDLVLEFQTAETVAPHIAHILKRADIPLIAIDVPHPNATYFGVDNFEVGYEAGLILGQYACNVWNGKVDWVLGVGMMEAGSFVQSRIAGAFEGVRAHLPAVGEDRFLTLDGRGMRTQSAQAIEKFLKEHRKVHRVLVAAATDSSALGVLDAVRKMHRERDFAIVGQDCIPEAVEEIQRHSAIIASISHEADTYGPRLVQLGISLLRGNAIPPYNYVRHRVVTADASLPHQKFAAK